MARAWRIMAIAYLLFTVGFGVVMQQACSAVATSNVHPYAGPVCQIGMRQNCPCEGEWGWQDCEEKTEGYFTWAECQCEGEYPDVTTEPDPKPAKEEEGGEGEGEGEGEVAEGEGEGEAAEGEGEEEPAEGEPEPAEGEGEEGEGEKGEGEGEGEGEEELECEELQLMCEDLQQCIPEEWRCDHEEDCEDGSDEWDCPPPEPRPGQNLGDDCTGDHNICVGDLTCLGYNHSGHEGRICTIGCQLDEDCDDEDFRCMQPAEGLGWCLPSDTFPEDPGCEDNEFECHDGSDCVPPEEMCDGENNCDDGTDEADCPEPEPEEFCCADGIGCVPLDKQCNGDNDCVDHSDEFNCPARGCGPLSDCFGGCHCPDANSDGRCDDRDREVGDVHDCIQECIDTIGQDSWQAYQARNQCMNDNCPWDVTGGNAWEEYICSMRHCLPELQACGDSYDTGDIPFECAENQFQCSGQERCIPEEWVCDGDNDCGDMSDEPADQCAPPEPEDLCEGYEYKVCAANADCGADGFCHNIRSMSDGGSCLPSSCQCDPTTGLPGNACTRMCVNMGAPRGLCGPI